jgi:hypothetical protein
MLESEDRRFSRRVQSTPGMGMKIPVVKADPLN